MRPHPITAAAAALVLAAAAAPARGAAYFPLDSFHGPDAGEFAYDEILRNGGFEANGLEFWDVVRPPASPTWKAQAGSGGSSPFGPADASTFATPWTTGGHALGTTSTLAQVGVLPPVHTGAALVRFEAFAAYDRIDLDLEWLDAAGGGLGAIDLGSYGATPGLTRAFYEAAHAVPDGAAAVRFRATGVLTNGNWIDSGFDHASIVLARPVPEPAAAGTALAAGALALRRRRR